MPLLNCLQALPELRELRIVPVLAKPGNDLNLDLARLLFRLSVAQNPFQYLRVHDQSIDIIPYRFHMNILIDELDCLRTQGMPEQFSVSAGRLHGFIDLRQPFIVAGISAEARIRRQGLPDSSEYRVFTGELVAHGIVR